MKKLHVLMASVLLLGVFSTQQATAQYPIFEKGLARLGQTYVAGEIIVKFKPEVTEESIAILNSQLGTSAFYTSLWGGFKRLRIPTDKTVEEMVEIYQASPQVEYAEANYIAHALMVPNDEFYAYQWHLNSLQYGGIHIEQAWDISTGSETVVAILDTGIAYEAYYEVANGWKRSYEKAPDLVKTCFAPGYDFVNKDNHPNDDSNPGHGTHIAGIIAQRTNNDTGTAGIAFGACLMPIKVLDSGGVGTYADVADGIIWATDQGAHIINLGLGGSQPSMTLKSALAYAYNSGVTIVAAAGNDGTGNVCYPAAYDDYVIAVGATRYDETRACYSNYGPSLDLMAPGGDLNVDQNTDGYGDGILQQTYEKSGWEEASWGYCFMEGTSMAAAQVSGVAALLIAEGVAKTPAQVREALHATAEDKGPAGWDPRYGWGIVDALAALHWVPGPWPPQLTADFAAELTTGGFPLTVQFTDKSTGDIISWLWDFGDGQTSTERNPSHVYQNPSSYTVSLKVASSDSSDTESKKDYITVTIPVAPEADFVGIPTLGNAPLTVQFTNKSTCYAFFYIHDEFGLVVTMKKVDALGHVTGWLWDFGDGEKSTEVNPSHTYQQPGYYTVSLTATGAGGSNTLTRQEYIHATPPPGPVAEFTAQPTSGDAPLTVQFTDQTVGDVTHWLWNFGDGETSAEQNPSHTYQDPGDYAVTLTARGRGGSDAETKSKYIHVTLPDAHVSIGVVKMRSFWGKTNIIATVTITAKSADGPPITGATVQGHWGSNQASVVSGTTDKNGKISFQISGAATSGTVTFTVDKVTKAGQQYELVGQTSNSLGQ